MEQHELLQHRDPNRNLMYETFGTLQSTQILTIFLNNETQIF